MDLPDKFEEKIERVLTSIQSAYTLPCTQTGEENEVDQVIINNFLGTLAEVASNIAARRAHAEQTGKQDPTH
jgi:hypothetical protein